MIQYIMWIISFVTLYISLILLNFLYVGLNKKESRRIKIFPSVSIVVPAYNEEKTIIKTLESILKLDYPKDKIEIIVVNDGSTDNTQKVAENFIKEHKRVCLVNKKNSGKAAALNTALDMCKGELFACVDADSTVDKNSLKNMIYRFKDKKVGSVITSIQVNNPKNLYEKTQRIEYVIAVLIRKIMGYISTLSVTPGVLSVYRAGVLKEVGKFDEGDITEDYEIAMRLKYYGYNVDIETNSFTYTNAPNSFRKLWRQRVRWFRGFISNHIKYREMIFNKRYGFLGCFQLPLDFIAVLLLLTATLLIAYSAITNLYEFILRSIMIDGYLKQIFYVPSLKKIILTQNVKIMLPILISLGAFIYLFYRAHRLSKAKIKYPLSIWSYFIALPYVTSLHWISAIFNEIIKTKRKW